MQLEDYRIISFFDKSFPRYEECYEIGFYEKQLKIEKSHFWFQVRNQVVLDAVRFVQKRLKEPVKMLEIGCGAGNVLSFLESHGFAIAGADYYLEGLKVCRGRTQADLYQLDVRSMPFDSQWNVIGCFDVIEHINEDELALQNIYQALKKNGRVILTVPAIKMLYSKHEGTHRRRYSKRSLEEKVKRAGFQIEKISYFFSILFPFFFISRLWKKMIKEDVFRSEDLRIHPILNKLFFILCLVDRQILKLIPVPIGSSLLCIARKM